MKENSLDFTNTFCSLMKKNVDDEILFKKSYFIKWYKRWSARRYKNKENLNLSLNIMRKRKILLKIINIDGIQ